MRRYGPQGLFQRGSNLLFSAATSAATSLYTSQRTPVSIGGRGAPIGFSRPQERSPRIKQGSAGAIARHIPGTTKVRYTNKKGRTFTFSIPASQITHPPVLRRGAAASGWQEIDTSFSDVGDLESDMPTEVEEQLQAAAAQCEDGVVVEMNEAQLHSLQRAFVQLCRDYVLMDLNGMKTSMTYSELNTGPDYEHFDRKSRRRRHWIALRHRFEDVRELLWPTDAAAAVQAASAATAAPDAEQQAPVLSTLEMMEALNWVEAASTFAIRKHRPFDTVDASEFAPLDLSREVRVVAECLRVGGLSAMFHVPNAEGRESVTSIGASASPSSAVDSDAQRGAADRFISFAALCTNHGVPLSAAFSPSAASAAEATQTWLTAVPPLTRVKDALRVMALLQAMNGSSSGINTASGSSSSFMQQPLPSQQPLQFSKSESGDVFQPELLAALCRLASASLFTDASALENVDETELCTLLRFVVELQEQNTCFLQQRASSPALADPHAKHRETLQHLTQLALTRCRQLLYKHDGPQATLVSGDEENVPLVDLQAFAEHSHPEVRVHEKVGRSNAQGLRFARLQSAASATIAELLRRMEDANTQLVSRTHGLCSDLLNHIAHKTALGKNKLTLDDIIRALPLLADAMVQKSEAQVRAAYDRLFVAMSTGIGVALQHPQKPAAILSLLEGLAACHYAPTSYKLLEMVTLRLMMRGDLTLGESGRALTAMLKMVGPHHVSQVVQQALAMRVVSVVEKMVENKEKTGTSTPTGTVATISEVLQVLRALRFGHYLSFASLMTWVAASRLTAAAASTPAWTAAEHVRLAVLYTSAAAQAAASEEQPPEAATHADVINLLTENAREEMRLGLRRSEEKTMEAACVGEDAYQECLAACAALQLDTAPPALKSWSQRTPPDNAFHRPLHSLCTPLLAVSTLEATEAMQLVPSSWYDAYNAYLTHALVQMLHAGGEGTGTAESGVLLADDAETAERTLYLRYVSQDARTAAAQLLEREVSRLDALLTDDGAPRVAAAAAGYSGEGGLPIFTFQQKALSRQSAAEAMEERLLRYCAALKHAMGDTTEVPEASKEATITAIP